MAHPPPRGPQAASIAVTPNRSCRLRGMDGLLAGRRYNGAHDRRWTGRARSNPMRERLIFRPNSITVDEWEKLTREEQIRCCKERQPKRQPFDISRLLKNANAINSNELAFMILENLTEDNVREVLSACPLEVMQSLQANTASLHPDSDDESWSKDMYVKCVSYAPWVTADEIRQIVLEEKRKFRNGVRLFRKNAS